MVIRTSVALAMVGLTLQGAHAAPAPEPEVMSTGVLRSYCSSADAHQRQLCSIYILGAVQALQLALSPGVDKRVRCIKDDLTEQELVGAFMASSGALKSAYPADMKLPAVGIVSAAIARRFPCSPAKK